MKNGKPFGYFVIFKKLVQVPMNVLDVTDQMLKKCGCSLKICREKYEKSDKLHYFMSLEGRLVWMNLRYSEYTSQTNDMIMYPILFSMIQANPENYFLQEDLVKFIKERGEVLYYFASINLENGGVLEANFLLTKINTDQGIPLMYHIEVTPVLKEKK